MKKLNEKIIDISKSAGFELIGFCDTKNMDELKHILNLQESLGYKTPFQIGKIQSKCFQDTIYKSAVVVGLTYNKLNIKNDNDIHLSSIAVGKDYHKVLKDKLKIIKDYLNSEGFTADINVDNNEYDERYLAYKAGLGFYGKNGLIINELYGSYFFIGVILTNAVFEYNNSVESKCLNCGLCKNACPTKAINDCEILNGNVCLSYLTQKKELTIDEEKYINSCVYGCDICASVCPYNREIPKSNNFLSDGVEFIEANKFLKMSKKEYNELYKNNSSHWRGKKIIDRNIILYKENKLKNK